MLLLIDFSKAFDMVDHEILLNKLNHYGIRGNTYKWIKSYLSDRKQYVAMGNKNSPTLDMVYGVPQGSILGPLLFIIYINDITNVSNLILENPKNCIMYADDANILITAKNLIELQRKFDNFSTNLETWVNANGLALNLKKTNYILFSNRRIENLPFIPKIFDRKIERKQSARFLGVIMNENLTWKDHILAIKAKMSRYVGVLFKLKKILPLFARKIYSTVLCNPIFTTAHLFGVLVQKVTLNNYFRSKKRL